MGSKLLNNVSLVCSPVTISLIYTLFVLDSQSKSVIVNCATADEICEKEDWFSENAPGSTRYG